MPRITFVLFVLLAVGLLFGMSPDTDPGATPTETTQPTKHSRDVGAAHSLAYAPHCLFTRVDIDAGGGVCQPPRRCAGLVGRSSGFWVCVATHCR